MWYVMWIASISESSNIWTQHALSDLNNQEYICLSVTKNIITLLCTYEYLESNLIILNHYLKSQTIHKSIVNYFIISCDYSCCVNFLYDSINLIYDIKSSKTTRWI